MATENFNDYLKRRFAASDAFVNGDIEPLIEVSASEEPASIFGPMGGCVFGVEKVNAVNTAGAKAFAPGAENEFEEFHQSSDGKLGYWTGIQRSKVIFKGKDETVPMALRLTEIYRRDDDGWKLIHRHADTKVEKAEKA
ncbi:MAG: DUF4440 domain-containing protein [Acidobacteriota bacterium]